MASAPVELEGTWEEILARSEELAGQRVRVTVLPSVPENGAAESELPEANRRMLQWLDEWEREPLTEEEKKILDEFEQFRKDHPITFRDLRDAE